MSRYIPDVEFIEPLEWHDDPTKPGVRTTAQLVAERDALDLVRQWLDGEAAQERRE